MIINFFFLTLHTTRLHFKSYLLVLSRCIFIVHYHTTSITRFDCYCSPLRSLFCGIISFTLDNRKINVLKIQISMQFFPNTRIFLNLFTSSIYSSACLFEGPRFINLYLLTYSSILSLRL